MVALFGLFQPYKVLLQLTGFRERHPVYPLEHFFARIPAPVCAGNTQQPERPDPAGIGKVGAGAEVHKLVLLIKGDIFPFGQLVNQLDFVRLVLHQIQSLVFRQRKKLKRQRLFDDFFHLVLDFLQIFLCKRLLAVEIIVKTAVGSRADCKLYVWIQPLDRMRHNMGRGMPKRLLALVAVKGQYLNAAVLCKRKAQIHHLSVYLGGTGGFI